MEMEMEMETGNREFGSENGQWGGGMAIKQN